jgi:uncharacterized protein DUF302
LSPLAPKAKQYTYGNPILAWTMVKHDIGACSHVPFRVLIYETADGESHIAYDLPSTLMGQLENRAVNEATVPLDEKVIAMGDVLCHLTSFPRPTLPRTPPTSIFCSSGIAGGTSLAPVVIARFRENALTTNAESEMVVVRNSTKPADATYFS